MADSEPTTDELQQSLEQRRHAAGISVADPSGDRFARKLEQMQREAANPTPADLERERQMRASEEQDRRNAVAAAWRAFLAERGDRYADCRLANFEASTELQRRAVDALRRYAARILESIADGESLVLFGPKGTGKDHLLVAMAHAAVFAGKSVKWLNGMDLFGDVRDRMGEDRSERGFVQSLVWPDVLYLSDPLPPSGALTDFQQAMLFRVLDGRYSRRKPTWATVNVQNGQELATRMGPQNADRLKDGALAIHCNWPSFRKAGREIR